MKNRVKKFNQFEVINEGKTNAALRGYPAETIVERIGQMMEIFPDRVKFGVPSDNKGLTLTYRDANGAIQKIQDVSHYYNGKGEEVKFYCWNISYAGSWDATKSLREKIDEFGGFGREQNMNLKKIIDYFTQNPEDVDNIRSISISIDSNSIRKAKKSENSEMYPQPNAGSEAPKSEEGTEE